ncbi:phosphatidylserine/phosphatidylglycerophosphate/cardiolipin synthase-like enzyme [Burkholderia sp. OAS925]|uniref:phospholipase D-like domain-containing protein n=1 Tax=Paraburkholderia TaxID=1822464 RepID=UPI001789E8ED|nr:phospholipase D-like domain-containing protein [Paraburkholderia graminis]MDR6475514.1 phosphatidylserine/phosphatidylglycerophosphate/cardiolipin synthase-like enzyme [Paraburkholderia graminis]
MTQQPSITVPIALSCTAGATITLPWFVQKTEYNPATATFRPLVNGEEAFGTIYDAILNAKRCVDIICWGFQPSMYFRRGSNDTVPIGQLLARKGADGVRVRLLCWMDDLHVAEWSENNMPGNNVATMLKPYMPDWLLSMPGMSMVSRDYQKNFEREFDLEWYRRANLSNVTKGRLMRRLPFAATQEAFEGIEFATRDFSFTNRAEIAYRTAFHGKDSRRSAYTTTQNSVSMGATEPTHHQKMVLVDYEMPDQAVGFVMGHNMLDTYWDRDDHSYIRMHPRMGRNGEHPREDMSSRVSGPILEYLNLNFCQAWDDATGQTLTQTRAPLAKQLKLRRDFDTPVMAQIVRTQSQKGKKDIEALYLQAANNATKFIYIENQYFRYVPLAEKIKQAVSAQTCGGRDAGKHGSIYLFVVTNSNDEGIGVGTVNTYRMLDSLGCAHQLPGVATLEREDARQAALKQDYAAAIEQQNQASREISGAYQIPGYADSSAGEKSLAQSQQKLTQAKAKRADLEKQMKAPPQVVVPGNIPGLKVHVCTLVAPDSPPGKWDYVYVHAKLMVVDDVFMTLGSANVNIRSMEADSELNICHENMAVTQPLRRRLWNLHTKGFKDGASDSPDAAFKAWTYIVNQNARNQKSGLAPIASLVGFMRTSSDRSYAD